MHPYFITLQKKKKSWNAPQFRIQGRMLRARAIKTEEKHLGWWRVVS